MRVTALDGTEWEVSRRTDGVGSVAAVLFLALTVAAWTLAIVFVLPSLLVLLELLALAILLIPARRAYVVAATNTTTGEIRPQSVRGWRRSRHVQRELAQALSRSV